jgi:dienelactone hydrolase
MIPRPLLAATLAASLALGVTAASAADYQTQGLTAADNALPVFYEALRAKMTFPLGWKDGANPATWRATGLAKARDLMLPGDDKTAFQPAVIDEIDRGAYVARKVVFNVTAESRVLALVLVPKGKGPFPAALMLHDHGSKFDIGKEKWIEPWGDPARQASAKEWSEKFFSGRMPGDELAKRGYVVLATDALGWGDRTVAGFQRESQQALASNLFNLGSSYAGLVAQEDVRASEFLASLPEVDKTKVAAVGFSMGAFRAWQVAALSDAVTAAIADCWLATMPGLMVPGNNQLRGQSAFPMLHPGIGRYLDYPDVAGLAAPKPMLVYAGEKDGLFPLDSVNEAFAKMKKIWTANGADAKLETKFWPYGHVFLQDQQEAAFSWLDKQFGRK